MGEYVVVARSRASAVFYPGDSLAISSANRENPFRLLFQTLFEGGFDAPLPRDMWVEARGSASSLEEAAETFGNAALEVSAVIAFAVNASMGRLEIELAFDVTTDKTEHEFLQTFLPNRPITSVPGRRVKVDAVVEILNALSRHSEEPRLRRAIVQYVEALQSWRPGQEITCVAHLYMGVEALTKAALREHLRKSGKTQDDLLKEWNIQIRDLDGEARRKFIFQNDAECFSKAKEVSDTFEHGFGDFGTLQKPAREIIVKTARYLRRAIVALLGVGEDAQNALLSKDYDDPRGPLLLVRYMRGKLVGPVDKLAPEGQMYPVIRWKTELQAVQIDKDGKYSFTPRENLTFQLGEGVQFHPEKIEIWDGSSIKDVATPAAAQALDNQS